MKNHERIIFPNNFDERSPTASRAVNRIEKTGWQRRRKKERKETTVDRGYHVQESMVIPWTPGTKADDCASS